MMECRVMRRSVIAAVVLVAAVATAVVLVTGQGTGRSRLIVGGVEDAAKWSNPAGNMELATRAGFGTIVLSSVWTRPETTPDNPELERLRAAIDAARAVGIRPIVAVYSFSGDTPVAAADRVEFGSYAAAILRGIPELRTISLGNEPNSNTFWMPQFGRDGTDAAATAYFELLETAYPLVKAASPHVTVIGGSLAARGGDKPHGARPTHSPTRFIEDLGAAFRSSGLAYASVRPLLDPPLPGELLDPAHRARPALDLDRDRRLPESSWRSSRGRSGVRRRSSTASTGSRPRSRAPSRVSTRAPVRARSGR